MLAIEALERIMRQVRDNSQALSLMNQSCLQMSSEENWNTCSYSCDKCRDTGWIVVLQENAMPLVRECQCKEIERIKNQWKVSGINPESSTQTFNNFQLWNESSKRAKETAMAYYKAFESSRKTRKNSMLFCGQVGSGKSHLSVALALNFLKKGIKVVYMPYRDIITKLKQNMLDDEYYQRIISKYQTCEVLLLDDLFKGKVTESDINIIFEIINHRYLNYLPVIVSSEFTVEDLLNRDEGIGSRIYEMCKDYVVEISRNKNNNYRLR